eukprot:Lithocolla_globosa_v1_NODE_689_length_3433_cov_2.908526.p3 type:complete len:285 gc:universal NODE_689_length_3433_cov_2.908526:2941-2087(-)
MFGFSADGLTTSHKKITQLSQEILTSAIEIIDRQIASVGLATRDTNLNQLLKLLQEACKHKRNALKTNLDQHLAKAGRNVPVREITDHIEIQFVDALNFSQTLNNSFSELNTFLALKGMYEPLDVSPYLPDDGDYTSMRRSRFVSSLQLRMPLEIFTYRPGNAENIYFIWHVEEDSESRSLTRSYQVAKEIEKTIPVYHTNRMRESVSKIFQQLNVKVPKMAARLVYRLITGDSSVDSNALQNQVDERVEALLMIGDEDLIMDARTQNGKKEDPQLDAFWGVLD